MQDFELGILNFIQDKFACPFLDAVMPYITLFGEHGIFWMALTAILLIPKKTRKLGLSMAIALLLGYIFGNLIIKNVVARSRPYETNTDFKLLVAKLSDKSFPSGHTLASFEASVCIFIRHKKWGIAAIALAVAIALSRLYLYVHFPTDVLAGMLMGILFAVIGTIIANKIYKKADILSKKKNID
ncbi:MAG: phosphatase PAP2 family protein [Clostridia bacterium]|nr:phosphatase PAP2 family protein [Clostridia bacterium]